MPTGPDDELSALRARVDELEDELQRERGVSRFNQRLLASKEREVQDIYLSRAWGLLSRVRGLKYRLVDPFLGMFGIHWPKRRAGREVAAASAESRFPASHPDKHDVVCLSIIDWGDRFQRPQQLMRRFAAAGHRVFYAGQGFRREGPAWAIVEKAPNVYEVTLRGADLNVYQQMLNDEHRDLLFDALDALRRDLSLAATTLFVQLPFWWPLAKKARARFAWPVIYDCMDHHAGFSSVRRQGIANEDELLAEADLVVASSAALGEKAKHDRVLLLRNGCDFEHFAAANAKTGNARPVIGYYGAIADWFDSTLVAALAKRRPDWDFVLVGSTWSADLSPFSGLANVSMPGEQPYESIPLWLGRFDVAIIPFKRTSLTEATNPVKVYEMLAGGKPVVAVPIPELTALAPMVRLASTAGEFERQIEEALAETGEIEPRQAFAKQHTWDIRFDVLERATAEVFPRASIVIVTFNNLEITRQCLESLFARMDWPNVEVIVVDNASSDGTVEYLREVPNIRAVFNDSNLGFAAASNIGLSMATGAYLVLLNNDTVLPRGWLSALIRHLHANPAIGLIGPVSNAVGNEARIDVGYQEVDDMPRWAAEYVREHDGETFSIPMLGMFCVVMRREVFAKVGPLDERFAVGMFEDDDYSRRVRDAGYELICARDSFVHHWMRASFKLLGEPEYARIFAANRERYRAKWGDDIAARVRAGRGAVIFPPSIGWYVDLVQRPHHLARAFARKGFTVLFDVTGSRDAVDGFLEVESGINLVGNRPLEEIPDPLLWTFPYNYRPSKRVVYDWIDDLSVFPHDQRELARTHARALSEAMVVTCVARTLHEQATRTRSDALYLPNAVDYEHFAERKPGIAEELLAQRKPIAGYYGALAGWFDFDLLDAVAQRRADWSFVLIGAVLDAALMQHPLFARENVLWLGSRPYPVLPAYLEAFDVAMIPFAINRVTNATSPLKLYEYFAGGKPVVSTPLPECAAFEEVIIAATATEFADALDVARARGADPAFRDRVRATAKANSWDTRVDEVLRACDRS